MKQLDAGNASDGTILDHTDVFTTEVTVDYNQPLPQAIGAVDWAEGVDKDVLAYAPRHHNGEVKKVVSFFPLWLMPLHYREGHRSVPLSGLRQFLKDFNLKREDLHTAATIRGKGQGFADIYPYSIQWQDEVGNWYRADFGSRPRGLCSVKIRCDDQPLARWFSNSALRNFLKFFHLMSNSQVKILKSAGVTSAWGFSLYPESYS